METSWPLVTLESLVEQSAPITYGVVQPGQIDPDGVLFIRSGDIVDGRIRISELRTISNLVSSQYTRTVLRGGEIVVSLVGNPGQTAIVPLALAGANIARQVGLIRVSANADARFIQYFLSSPNGQRAMGSYTMGSVQQVINLRDLKQVTIPLPPLNEQRAIASILGALDDKVELNRKMSATLEAISRALFKSWFVDFDPVQAKAKNRHTGLSPEIAALFPSTFEESELGQIPQGWTVQTIGDIIIRLGVGKKYEQKTVDTVGTVPVLDQGRSGVIGYHSNEPGVVATADHPVIVFANHTCYMRLIDVPFSAIQNVLPFVGKNVETAWVFYAALDKQAFVEYKGHWPDFIRHPIVLPSMPLCSIFSNLIKPLLARISLATRATSNLTTLRELLLPKLISGELPVPEAERILEMSA
jgi:type I restriction enzyme, S subunit